MNFLLFLVGSCEVLIIAIYILFKIKRHINFSKLEEVEDGSRRILKIIRLRGYDFRDRGILSVNLEEGFRSLGGERSWDLLVLQIGHLLVCILTI